MGWTRALPLCYVPRMNDGSAFQKRRQLLDMLTDGLVMLHLDPRVEGVIVPEQFAKDSALRLNIAYQFKLPALDIGAEGVYAVLSFNRKNFACTVPWPSIFAMTKPHAGHDGVVWPHSVPPELKGSFAQAGIDRPTRLRPTGSDGSTPAPEPPARELEVVSPAGGDSAEPTPRRGHLKLVKG